MAEQRTGRRFPLKLPITIHSRGAAATLGSTGNLSSAAVYMRADTQLENGSAVEFEIRLPPELTGAEQQVAIACRGRVVRTEAPGDDGKRGIACVIDTYDFARQR